MDGVHSPSPSSSTSGIDLLVGVDSLELRAGCVMPHELSDADTDRVRSLLVNSELEGVFFHEQSARRHEATPKGMTPDTTNVEVGIQFRMAEKDFGIRVMAEVQNLVGSAVVVASAEYTLTDDYEPSRRDVMMFANEVAVMTIFPYLREGISSATAKVLGEPVFLPIAPRGAIGFDVEELGEE